MATLCSRTTDGVERVEHSFVVDAGDGKGYLSSRLALEHKLKVLGVDASTSNTDAAVERRDKLGVSTHEWSKCTRELIQILP